MIPLTLSNPTAVQVRYPGLRAFKEQEHPIFFGRDDEVGSMLEILQLTRFLTLLGPSGAGKTSLLQAGLIAQLTLKGEKFAGKGGADWRVVRMTPGAKDPIWNLSVSLSTPGILRPAGQRDPHYLSIIDRRLRKNHHGLLDVFEDSDLGNGNGNLLIVIDQFEEVFGGPGKNQPDEAINFVNLLLTASRARDKAIYIAMALQSDFIGQITEFPGLSEAIMEGKYIVPSMNGKDLRNAIVKPLPPNASIDDDLVKELIELYENEERKTTDRKAPLPVLQYTLMRTLEEPIRASGGLPVHLSTLNFHIGGLSNDLDKIYDNLESPEEKWTCEKMFKALTVKKAEGLWHIRTETIGNLSKIAQLASDDEVIQVIRRFQEEGRAFLQTNEAEVGLHSNTEVAISHEFLVAEWERLKIWVEEESEARSIYRRLKEAADIYRKQGESKDDYLKDPQLSVAWDLFRYHKTSLQRTPEKDWVGFNKTPNIFWAERYDEPDDNVDYPYTTTYLGKSHAEYVARLEAERKSTENRLRAARRRTIIFGILFLLSAIAGLAAVYFGFQAGYKQWEASKLRDEAYASRDSAEVAKVRAMIAQLEAEIAQAQADSAQKAMEVALADARRERIRAVNSERELAVNVRELEKTQVDLEAKIIEARELNKLALQKAKLANCLRIKSQAQAVAAFSLNEKTDTTLKGLLAKKAFELNQDDTCGSAGVKFNDYEPNIYSALHESLRRLEGERYNDVLILNTRAQRFAELGVPLKQRNPHFGVVRGMVFRDQDPNVPRATYETLFTASGDGKVFAVRPDYLQYVHPDSLRYVLADPEYSDSVISPINQQQLLPPRLYKDMALSHNGKWIALGGDMASIYLLSTLNPKAPPIVLPVHRSQGVFDIVSFSKNTADVKFSGFITTGADKRIQFHSLRGATEDFFLETGTEVVSLAVSPDGSRLAGGTKEGSILLWSFDDPQQLKPVLVQRLLQGNGSSPITSLSFGNDNNLIASGHENGLLMLWKVKERQIISRPGHTAGITDLQFWFPEAGSDRSPLLSTSGFDGSIRVYLMQESNGKYPLESNAYQPLVLKDSDIAESLWAASLTFDLKGKYLFAGYRNGLIKKWTLDPRELYGRVQSDIKGRAFSDEEKEKFLGEE